MATKVGVPPDGMRFVGRAAAVAEAHESFTWQAVGEAGCRATDVAVFLGCRPPNVAHWP